MKAELNEIRFGIQKDLDGISGFDTLAPAEKKKKYEGSCRFKLLAGK